MTVNKVLATQPRPAPPPFIFYIYGHCHAKTAKLRGCGKTLWPAKLRLLTVRPIVKRVARP